MFNKSIIVALILCACYLGVIQGLDLVSSALPAVASGAQAVSAGQQLTQNIPPIPPLPAVGHLTKPSVLSGSGLPL